MDTLKVTVVGQDLFRIVTDIFESVGFTHSGMARTSMVGNMKSITYEFPLAEETVIERRKTLMNALSQNKMLLMPMYVHGDWMRVVVMHPIRT